MDAINYAEVQLYVDALSVNAQTIDRRNDFFNKSPNIAKIKK